MNKFILAVMMTVLLAPVASFAQANAETSAPETFYRLYRDPSRPVCRTPECTALRRPRQMPANAEQYEEAISFLVAGARACLVDCSCRVQGAATPRYCEAAAPPSSPAPSVAPSAPASTPATENAPPAQSAAPAAAPAPTAPATMPDPPLPPYMPQGMFGGQSFAQLGYCPSTQETTAAFSAVGIFDAIWYTPGMRRGAADMSMMAGGGGIQATAPMSITIQTVPSQYWMVITVNGREAMLLRNGQPQMVVQEMRNGGHCVRSALPAQTATSFTMELEGNRPDVEIGVYLYLPTASGALGALVPVPGQRVRTYQIADLLNWGNRIVISSTDGGTVTDR